MKRPDGFSVIELMVVIAVLGVVVAIALPSFRTMIENQRIRAAAESMRSGLQLARMEALKRGQGVVYSMANLDGSWIIGCEIPVADDSDGDGMADCPAQIQEAPRVEGGTESITVNIDTGVLITFTPLGLVRQLNQDGSAPFTQINVTVPGAGSDTKPMRVLLPAGGLSRVCDPSVTADGDTRKC